MKIALIDVPYRNRESINKDVNGGYGTITSVGNSPFARLIEYMKKSNVKLPLISFGYLAAIFSKKGFDVYFKTNENLAPDTNIVIIYGSMVGSKSEIEFAKKLKKRYPDCSIGFIGPFPSSKPELFIEHCDFIINGEPEQVALNATEKWKPEGIIKSKFVEDLDSLPFPKWDIFPHSKFSYFPVIKEKPFSVIQSSRGCSFSCGYYCPYVAAQGNKLRHRSISSVIEEIKYLKRKFNVKGFLFRDPLFSSNIKRAGDIAQAIIDNNLNVKWACETRLDLLNKSLIDLFYAAGLRSINVGIESQDEEVLRKSQRKSIKKVHQEEIISYCDKKGIKISAFYMLGLESDTKKSIMKTINYAKKLNTHVAQFTITTPIPGTPFYEDFKDKVTTNDFEKYSNYNLVFEHSNLSEKELMKLKEKAFVSYYFRPRYMFSFFKRMFF